MNLLRKLRLIDDWSQYSSMKAVSKFSLERHDGPYEKWPRKTRLYVNSVDTGQTVPGYVIEAQYRCADGYLLILSQDCLFEESNDFVLLDETFRTIARTSIGLMYHTFLLERHWPISAHCLGLDYGGGETYRLVMNKKLFGRKTLQLVSWNVTSEDNATKKVLTP